MRLKRTLNGEGLGREGCAGFLLRPKTNNRLTVQTQIRRRRKRRRIKVYTICRKQMDNSP